MAKFADYGFNKSHAAAYALLSYQTAWLKANHPTAFLAACMSLAISNTDKLAALRQEVTRLGVELLPPDINRSEADFTLETSGTGKPAIRYALAAVKKVGAQAMDALVVSRGDKPFAGIADFAARVDARPLNRMQLENLVRAGAFDGVEPHRARLFAGIDTVLKRAQSNMEEAASGQIGLFGATGAGIEDIRLPDAPEWPTFDRLAFEADAIGFHMTAHPLDGYRPLLNRLQVLGTEAIEEAARRGAGRVRVAGCVVDRKERPTRTGGKMAWLRISDPGGMIEVTLFSEVLSRRRDILTVGRPVLASVDLKLEGEAVRITANEVQDLEQVAAADGQGALRVWVATIAALDPIRSILARGPQGRGVVTLLPENDGTRDVEVVLPGHFAVTPLLAQSLKGVPGVVRVEEC